MVLFSQLFPGAMQTVSKKIVQSRTNSTLVGVFSIILVFISAFVNMVSRMLARETKRQIHAGLDSERLLVFLLQFSCDTTSLTTCVAEKLNTSAALVTPCLIRGLNVSVDGGLEICPSRGPSCPFPEVCVCLFVFRSVRRNMSHLCLSDLWLLMRLLFVSVFQLQRAADAAGLLRVPADQQHREAGPHAVHPAHLPAAGGVATSSTV